MGKYVKKRDERLLHKKRVFKSTAAAILSVALVFAGSAGTLPVKASSLDDLKQNQASLQQKGEQLNAQIEKLKNDKAQQQQYQAALEAKSVNLEQQIDGKDLQVKQLDADILQKQKSILEKQKGINANYEELKKRVYAIYLTGEASDLEVILNAKNIMDLADKAEILHAVSESDEKLINTLKAEINSVKVQKTAIEQNRKAVSEAKVSLQQDQQQLVPLAEESAKVIASLEQNQQNAEAARADNKKAEQAAAASVNQWLSNYYASQRSTPSSNAGNDSGNSTVTGGNYGGGSQTDSGISNSPTAALPAKSASGMIGEAEKYLGYPYVWGGSNPQTSFDCSGFVSWVIDHSGWNVGRLGVGGLYSICSPVSSSEAAPGDLVFYKYTYGGLPKSHVGIYLGNGQAIQCDNPGVEIVNIGAPYWQNHFDSFGRLP